MISSQCQPNFNLIEQHMPTKLQWTYTGGMRGQACVEGHIWKHCWHDQMNSIHVASGFIVMADRGVFCPARLQCKRGCVTFRRGLEDVKVSCADIHSDHSSGLSKTLQDYRYTPTFTCLFNKDQD